MFVLRIAYGTGFSGWGKIGEYFRQAFLTPLFPHFVVLLPRETTIREGIIAWRRNIGIGSSYSSYAYRRENPIYLTKGRTIPINFVVGICGRRNVTLRGVWFYGTWG